jgi:gliding motility-associated-like protein
MRKILSFVFILGSLYSYSQFQTMCGGSSATIVPTSTLSNPTYSLVSPTGTFSPAGGIFVVSPSVTTIYTIVANSGTITNTTRDTVKVNPQPNAVPTTTQSTCTSSLNSMNLNLTFNPATPAPGYTITWSTIPNGVLSPTQFSVLNGGISPGPYTATIVAIGGCSLITNFTINPQPAPALFTVTPFGNTHSITCITPTVELTANNTSLTYTWSSTSFSPVVSISVSLNAGSLGTISCLGQNPLSGCTTSYTFLIVQNVSVPTSTLSNANINITCTQSVIPTMTISASPSVNVSNCIYAPQGGTFCTTSYTTIYQPQAIGVFTHCAVNDENGCGVCKTFTVSSSDNYPTFSVNSPQSFTLGCSTKSVATINITGAQTTPIPGGPVSYTLLPPSYTLAYTTLPQSTYTVNIPGSWTVVVKDNTNNCETKNVISIIQNTFQPNISANVPRQVLDCGYTTTVLQALSETPNVSFNWGFTGTPGNINGSTVTVNINNAANQATLINTYTLTITDNGNACKSTSIIPMNQNIFPPKVLITSGGTTSLTCNTQTIVLTNQSSTGIPATSGYPTGNVISGYTWLGPSPQEPLQVSTTYIAQTIGTYTLIAKDMNNLCLGSGTIEIRDGFVYPTITPPATNPTVLDCGAQSVLITPSFVPSGLTYSWTAPAGSGAVGTKTNSSFQASTPGDFTVIATYPVSGCKTKGVFKVNTGTLTAKFTADKDSGYAPLPVIFTNNSESSTGNTGILSFWNYSNGDTSITTSVSLSPQTVYNQPGNYKVTIYASKGACRDTAFRTIKVFSASSLTVPNVFTPNGDGVNDLFFLKATNLTEVTMVIYDRWGHLTYEFTSTSGNVEWNGKNQFDKECADGVYFYYLKAKGRDGETYDQNGSINLLR